MKNGIRKFIQCLIEFNEMKKVQIMEKFTETLALNAACILILHLFEECRGHRNAI